MIPYLRRLTLSLALLWPLAYSAVAADVIAKSYRVGDLIKLTASDSVGWDVDSGLVAIPYDVSEDATSCYIGTGPAPTRFVVKASAVKTLANGKVVPHVLQRYLITITAGDPPAPGPQPPTPPGPPPPPSPIPPPDLPNDQGVGHKIYAAVVMVGDKAACQAAATSLTNCAVGLERSSGSEVAINASFKTAAAALSQAMAGAKWDTARKQVEQALNSGSAGGNWGVYVQLYREAAAAFAAAGR